MTNKPAKDFEYLSNNPEYVPDPEIEEFMEGEISRAPKDPEHLAHRLRDNTAASPSDTGGDLDADWEDAYAVGDEAPGGDNPTPDQDIVDDIGRAVGVEYQDNEELKGEEKIIKRDKNRWELDPASSDDWDDR